MPLVCFSLSCKTCFTRFLLSTDGVTKHTSTIRHGLRDSTEKYTNFFDNPGFKCLGHKMSQHLCFKRLTYPEDMSKIWKQIFPASFSHRTLVPIVRVSRLHEQSNLDPIYWPMCVMSSANSLCLSLCLPCILWFSCAIVHSKISEIGKRISFYPFSIHSSAPHVVFHPPSIVTTISMICKVVVIPALGLKSNKFYRWNIEKAYSHTRGASFKFFIIVYKLDL